MDHARKIGKPERTSPWTKHPCPPCSVRDKPLVTDEEIPEDRRLANWRRWQEDRRKRCEHFGKSTGRDYRDLLINAGDDYRRKVEMKELMKSTVNTADRKRADKFRGNPAFWKTPESLPKRGLPGEPEVTVTLTKKELNIASEPERIVLPELTEQEKGFTPKTDKNFLEKLEKNSKIPREKLSQKIKTFEAEEKDYKKLAVEGVKLGKKKPEAPRIPILTVTEAPKLKKNLNQDGVIALKIQDEELTPSKYKPKKKSNLEDREKGPTWSLIFRSTGPSIIERTIRLENRGTLVITYQWRCGSQNSNLPIRPARSSPFFFNKNKEVILPGQVTVLRVWFRSRVSCSATEFWTLLTDPQLCPFPLTFRFWGCCNPESLKLLEDHDSVDQYLNRRVMDTDIQEIIQEILDNVQSVSRFPSPAYSSLFLEREIYEAKNPSHFYHPELVRRLRDIYDSQTSRDSPAWSLSLDDLRGVLLLIRKPDVRNECLLRFNDLCRRSLEPDFFISPASSEQCYVYSMLSVFFDKFEEEEEKLKSCSWELEVERSSRRILKDGPSSRNIPLGSVSRKKMEEIDGTSSGTRSSSSLISTNSLQVSKKRSEEEFLSHREVFYVKIRAEFLNTIDKICGIVDTDSLKVPED